MLASDPLYITPADYIAAEETSPIRHEYRDGEVFAMTGGTRNHHAIAVNILVKLDRHLRGRGCRVFMEGMKTRVEASNSFYYPDVVVTCDDRDRPNSEQYIEHPRLIVEILSPNTARFDRTEKFADYRTIPSLMDYVLVETEQQAVEHFQKDDRGNWNRNDPTDPIQPASVNCAIALSDIYEDTDIPRR
jgi:Uma2 family endonuclease